MPQHDGRHLADDIYKQISLKKNCCILIQTSIRFIAYFSLVNTSSLFHGMAWQTIFHRQVSGGHRPKAFWYLTPEDMGKFEIITNITKLVLCPWFIWLWSVRRIFVEILKCYRHYFGIPTRWQCNSYELQWFISLRIHWSKGHMETWVK